MYKEPISIVLQSMMLAKSSEIILGVDPGTVVMGYAIICITEKKMHLLAMDVLHLRGERDIYARLEKIHSKVLQLIALHRPTCFAIEAPFFGKNVQSMLKLGRAQGVAIAAAMQSNLSVTEYSPKKVKQSITGNGNADKEQVWKMLQQLMTLKEKPASYDATDALAVAVCHHFQTGAKLTNLSGGFKDWSDFARKNESKIRR